MANYYDQKGKSISLTKQINSGGEGTVWTTNRTGCLAKIYLNPTAEKIDKLKAMIANPPDDPCQNQNHVSIAWPIDLIKDDRGNYLGFLMPEIKNSVQLLDVYSSKIRNKKFPSFNWYSLHITARNLTLIIDSLHSKDYIVGDMQTQNILVNAWGLVSLIDVDSFQIKTQNNVYRCSVGKEGFTPPELIGKDFKTMTQTRYHDRFRLAVIIHYLLFTHHPFAGQWTGSGDQPGQDDSVSKGYYPYNSNSLIKPSINTVELAIVHPELQKCFLKCFNEGHFNPTKRPSPQDWMKALDMAIKTLTNCYTITNHIYSFHYQKCYWCERKKRVNYDIFPHTPKALIIQSSSPSNLSPITRQPITRQPLTRQPPLPPVIPPSLKIFIKKVFTVIIDIKTKLLKVLSSILKDILD